MEAWGGVLAGEAPWEREGGGSRYTEERLLEESLKKAKRWELSGR